MPLPWLKPAVLTGGLVPAAVLAWRGLRGTLGANPIAEVLNQLGLLALIFLVAGLACTPLKKAFQWTWPIRLRRLLGLLAFFYATSHVLTYVGADQGFALGPLLADVWKRKFIFVGVAAWLLLVPLAVTSTDASVRKLGFKRWQLLHRAVYLSAGLAAVHFILRVKKDLTEPGAYAVVLAVLLATRVPELMKALGKRKARLPTRA